MGDKKLKEDILISYIAIIVPIIITFFLVRMETKYLGRELYGIYSLVNSTIGYIAILDLGVGQTITRYVAQYRAENKKDKIQQIAGHSFKSYLKIVIVGLVIGLFLIVNSKGIFRSLSDENVALFQICLFIALINVLLQIPSATFASILSGYKYFKVLKGMNLFRSIARSICIVILLNIKCDVILMFIIDLTINQCINIFNYMFVRRKLGIKLNFTPIDKNLKRELKGYSFFVFLGIITDQIFWRTDGILLGMMSTTSVVAVYAISSQIITYYMNLCSTFSSVFLPRIIDKITMGQGNSEINKFFIKASRYQFMFVGIILTSYIFLGKEFIVLWLGNNYENAYYYGLLIMISLTVPMFQTTGYQILYAMKKHKVRSIIYLFNAIGNIILSIFLFKIIGPIGVALSTAIAMIIGNTIFMNIYYRKTLQLNLFEFFKKTCFKTGIVMIIISCLYCIVNQYLQGSWIIFITKAVIINVTYIILIVKISFNEYERNTIRNIFYKIFRIQAKVKTN